MKFYIAYSAGSNVLGCELTKAKAVKLCRTDGTEGARVERLTLSCTPREAIKRLLGDEGGYADEQTTVYTQGI